MEKQHDDKSWQTTEPLKFNINEPRIIRWSEFLWWSKKTKTYTAKRSEQTLTELARLEMCGLKQNISAAINWSLCPPDISINSATLPLRSCRRSIVSFRGWPLPQAHTVGCSWENTLASHFCWRLSFAGNWLLLLSIAAYSDSTQKDLMKLIGNLPVQYEGESGDVQTERSWHAMCETTMHWWWHLYLLRPLLQLPSPALAAGFLPLHSSHMPAETHS